MKKHDANTLFVVAFRDQVTKKGYGAQAWLAIQTGISKSLICDILKGRSYGAEDKRRALALALGFDDYEKFLDIGRRQMGVPTIRNKACENEAVKGSEELVELLRENRRLRLKIERMAAIIKQLKSERKQMRLKIEGLGQACDPTVPGMPAAHAVKNISD